MPRECGQVTVAHDTDKWQAVVKTVMNLRVVYEVDQILASWDGFESLFSYSV
jgi:hypothetical protein